MHDSQSSLPNPDGPWPVLHSRRTVVLVVDLVESVRLMHVDERSVVERWQAFVSAVRDGILPSTDGRLVKSLGDGLLAEFPSALSAARAATAMHDWLAQHCGPLSDGSRLALRAGLHASEVYDAQLDLLGAGVNLAARVAGLAQPGETVATVEVRDQLHDRIDADIEDLGDCHLKHVDEPVRVYRLGPSMSESSLPALPPPNKAALQLAVAVMPFSDPLRGSTGLGDLVADGIIHRLSRSPGLQVVSRLSSAALRGRELGLADIGRLLGVRYVVSGSFVELDGEVTLRAELGDVVSGLAVWSGERRGPLRTLLTLEAEPLHELANALHHHMLEVAVQKATLAPLPALASYELLLGGIAMMHRASTASFDTSRRLLEALVERHPRIATPHAWLGKWQVLRSIQGVVDDPRHAASEALDHTARALDLEPHSALALAIEGFVHCHLRKDPEQARRRLEEACGLDPSEGFAWLFLAITQTFVGDAQAALPMARRALSLSPMDPLRYYYESLIASCELGAGDPAAAVEWGERSLRGNRQHLSTLRILIAAHAQRGEMDQARAFAAEVLRLRPGYSVAAYRTHSVAALYPFGERIADAMREAGIPAD